MEPIEAVEVEDVKVVCDGGGGAVGHPRVFLNMGGKRQIDCPYCGRRFILKDGAKAASGGH